MISKKLLTEQAEELMDRLYALSIDEAMFGNESKSNRLVKIADRALLRYSRRYHALR